MKFNELTISSHNGKRCVGRGISAGRGKTAGRGTKGQKSRTGSGKKQGFEGGQTPLVMRIPRLRGFRSHRPKTEVIYTSQLNGFKGTVDNKALFEAGLVSTAYGNVKVVTNGETTSAVKVTLQGATESAAAAIQKAGGSFTKVARPQRTAVTKKEN